MIRAQIQFQNDQLARLRQVAARQNRSVADLVRESVDRYLSAAPQGDATSIKERAKQVIGKFSTGASNTSEHHDDQLAEAFR